MHFGARLLGAAFVLLGASGAGAEESVAPTLEELSRLSIDDLANLSVTSVSKRAEPLADAPAAIFVIDHDDIHRSGAMTLPEILRLAPNLTVAQVSGSGYAITARGFNGTTTTNGAGNKLLVLIDGRTVYTPLYGGVFWDLQNVPPDDIERVEVISGPGAALWGANAVNGVINIITRSAGAAEGFSASVSGGTLETGANLRLGARIADDLALRIYGQGYLHGSDSLALTDASARDAWNKLQGGFRLDWTPGDAHLTFQGDAFSGREETGSLPPDAVIEGHNLLARWSQPLGASALQVQAYYDYNTLYVPGGLGDALDTYDIDLQHSFSWGRAQDIVWGGGVRQMHDKFANTASVRFLPAIENLTVLNGFVQDSIAVDRDLSLILGVKLEDDPFVDVEPLPSARLAWKLSPSSLVWAAVSRAVRAPTLWDRDLNLLDPSGNTVLGGGDFKSEKLIAYEAGYRAQPLENLSLSLSAYYNDYDDLRSIELSGDPDFPFAFGNGMDGETYGAEAWATYQPNGWWRLTGGLSLLHEDLRFKPGSAAIGGIESAGNDPSQQFFLRSSFDLPHQIELDIDARYVSPLPSPDVPGYVGLNARIGWHMTEHFELALSGMNLAGTHREFGPLAQSIAFHPSGVVTLTWNP